jgi:hypothetical protein
MKKIILFMLLAVSANSYSQAGLKAIKINAPINLNTTLVIPSGAIVLVGEPSADLTAIKQDTIPCNMSIQVFVSQTAYNSGASPVKSMSDFSNYLHNLKMPLSDYETLPTQDLLIGVVRKYLETIYPNQTEVINL